MGASFLLLSCFNPYLTNGFSHHYHFGESNFISTGFRCDFKILFKFSMKFLLANRIAPDGRPRSAAIHLGLWCLHTVCPTKGTPGLNELSFSISRFSLRHMMVDLLVISQLGESLLFNISILKNVLDNLHRPKPKI